MNKIIKKFFAPIAVFSLALGVGLTASKVAEGVSAAVTYTGSEDFEGTTNLTGSYASNSFTGSSGVTFSYVESRNNGGYLISGEESLMFAGKSNAKLEFTVPNGLAGLKFQYRKAFTGTGNRQLGIKINDVLLETTPTFGSASGALATIFDYSNETISYSGPTKVTIYAALAKQAVIDNIQWADNATSDVVTALTVLPTSKTYFTTDKLLASDFDVTITKNGAAGTSSDYTAKIGTGTGGTFTGTDIVWGTTQPTTANTTIQFKSKYPTIAGGSTYLTADVALTVNAPLLDSISVTTQPIKKTYNTNDEFDPTGMIVEASYDNETSKTISNSSLSFSPSPLTQGTTTVTISYTEGSVTKTATVSGLSVTNPTSYSATLAYPNGEGTTNMTSENNASSVGLNPSIFEVLSNEREPNSLYIGLNKDGEVRLYNGTTKGNVLTVNLQEAYNNYIIKSLSFTFGSKVSTALIKANGSEIHNGSLTSNSTLTFNHLYASTFSIENIGTAQIYVLSVSITYLTHEQAAIDFAENVVNGVGKNAEGSCATAYSELSGIFNALSADSISFYNASTDTLFMNAKARMAYLAAWVAANSPRGTANPLDLASNTSITLLIGILGLTSVVGFYLVSKKKYEN